MLNTEMKKQYPLCGEKIMATSEAFLEPEVGIREPFERTVSYILPSSFSKNKKKASLVLGLEYAIFLEDSRLPLIRCGVNGKVQLIETTKSTKNLWIWFEKGSFWGRIGYLGLSRVSPDISPGVSVKLGSLIGWPGTLEKKIHLRNTTFQGHLYVEVRRLPEDSLVPFSTFE